MSMSASFEPRADHVEGVDRVRGSLPCALLRGLEPADSPCVEEEESEKKQEHYWWFSNCKSFIF